MKKNEYSVSPFLVTVLCTFLLLVTAGCINKATYPKESIVAAIKNICLSEYSIDDVQVKIAGKTVGVYFKVPTLYSPLSGFDKKAMELFENVSLSVRRVCMSTNADLDFCSIIAADQKNSIEFVVTSYMPDIKKAMYSLISRSDMSQRMFYRQRPNVSILGNKRIKQFFEDLSDSTYKNLFSNNFSPGISFKNISAAFFKILQDRNYMEWRHFEIMKCTMRSTGESSALFYVKVKETYKALPDVSDNTFSYPNGFEHEYLIDIYVIPHLLSPGIRGIYALNDIDPDGTPVMRDFPEKYFENSDTWNYEKSDFFLTELTFNDFLSHQIAQRIKAKILSAFKDIMTATILIEPILDKTNTLTLNFFMKPDTDVSRLNDISSISQKIYEDVCAKYDYHDFSGLILTAGEKKEFYRLEKPF